MTYADWMIKTQKLSSCSCDYGCPCEFNGRPTRSHCEGLDVNQITEGYFKAVRLDGLRFASLFSWPGPVHEGGGVTQGIIDARATPQQVEALFTILSGKEQEPTTAFNIYGSTIEKEYDPLFTHIEFEWDLQNRSGRGAVQDVLEATYAPIRNPVTGAPHRASIKLPHGFEFREAEIVSSTFWTRGDINQNYQNVYGFLTYASYGPYGVIEEHSYPVKHG